MLIVFLGPSGTGKTTVMRCLHRAGVLETIEVFTTRPRRPSPDDDHGRCPVTDEHYDFLQASGHLMWTSPGGRPEAGETEEVALVREIKEELGCDTRIVERLGTFEAKAVFDPGVVRLSAYLVELIGQLDMSDPELEEFRFISEDYGRDGIKLPTSIEDQVIPFCVRRGLLQWSL
jgi:8-oxo-dGTP pyrophosphatase MutT (NUDIX family)